MCWVSRVPASVEAGTVSGIDREKFTVQNMHKIQLDTGFRKDKEVDRNLIFHERAPNVSSLLQEHYNGTI